MFFSYIQIAAQTWLRNPAYFAVNYIGLAVGITFCLMMGCYVEYETNYDSWVSDHSRVYRLESVKRPPGLDELQTQTAPAVFTSHLEDKLQGLETLGTAFQSYHSFKQNNVTIGLTVLHANTGFIEIYKPKVLRGDLATSMNDAYSVILTESVAEKFFGVADPINQSILTSEKISLKVGAVIQDWPKNSHLSVQLISPILSPLFKEKNKYLENWGTLGGGIYLKFGNSIDNKKINERLNSILKEVAPTGYGGGGGNQKPFYKLNVRPLEHLHLYGKGTGISKDPTSPYLLYSLIGAAILVLVISCANYTILFSTKILARSSEFAIRKVLGASPAQISTQISIETFLLCLLSGITAALLVFISWPFLISVLEQPIPAPSIIKIIFLVIIILLFASILSVIYPLMVCLKIPIRRALSSSTYSASNSATFNLLLFLQFGITIGIVGMTILIYLQLEYIENFDIGYETESTLVLERVGNEIEKPSELLVEQLKMSSLIIGVGRINIIPGTRSSFSSSVKRQLDGPAYTFETATTDLDLFSVLGATVLAGRTFNNQRHGDIRQEGVNEDISVVINSRASEIIGFDSAYDAIGKRIYVYEQEWKSAVVIGVVKDMYFKSLHNKLLPTLYIADPSKIGTLLIKVEEDKLREAQKIITDSWDRYYPNESFQLTSLKYHLERQYSKENRQVELLMTSSLLCLILAIVGLYSVSVAVVNRKKKEIAIRKILGAQNLQIFLLLLSVLYIPLFTSVLISYLPFNYLSFKWLQSFIYFYDQRVSAYALSIGFTVFLSFLVIFLPVIRAAVQSPSKFLKYD